MQMHLLVGIDTEGDNQWDAAARANQRFENIYALPRLHALFARHGVRPTYVITHPVASDRGSAEVLRALKARRRLRDRRAPPCVGNAACTAEDVRRHPYASNLPLRQFEDQLASLTDAIERAVGERPVSYRSGRFGFSAAHVPALEKLGYRIESSVAPLFYEAHKNGPGLRRGAADALLPVLRQRDEAGHERPAGSAGLGGAAPPPAETAAVSLRERAAATTRRSASSGSSAWRACAGCGRRTRRSTT